MRQSPFALVLLVAAVLAGCGGSKDRDPVPKFNAQVSFGDSLSDVGTYAVGGVKALGGGKYTVNDIAADGKNIAKIWTEVMATTIGLPAPCAAETGLLSNGELASFAAAISFAQECTSYAQGGARVTEAVGVANVAYVDKRKSSQLGQLTVPVATQISNHLAKGGGKFNGDEIVFVLAGGNDLLFQVNQLELDAMAAGADKYANTLIETLAAGSANPTAALPVIQLAFQTELAKPAHTTETLTVAATKAAVEQGFPLANVPAAVASATVAAETTGAAYAADPEKLAIYVAAMARAGDQLATLVKTQIVANGANHVTVLTLPDASKTPYALAQSAKTQDWISAMVIGFNLRLVAGLVGQSKVLLVDAYAFDRDQAKNPGLYGFSNVTAPACADVDSDDPLLPPKNALHSALVCNKSNLVAGTDQNYKFADTVHPTPFTHQLLAQHVSKKMVEKGWF